MDDRSLLDEYVRSRSQDAFQQLVTRHLPLVYSTARRMVCDSQLAEEVAQSAFTTLAQKAESIRPPQVIGGWLYNTTRHLAMNATRTEQRRREREQTAVAMQTLDLSSDNPGFAEHLEPAMAELDANDRDALVLRFLENRSLREVGAEFGISEDAARKRVERALERLRAGFERQGIAVTTVLLATAVTATTMAAPAGLAATITTAALGSVAAATLAQTTAITAHWLNAKVFAAVASAAVLAATGTYLLQEQRVARANNALRAKEKELEAFRREVSDSLARNKIIAPTTNAQPFATVPESAIPGRYRWIQANEEKGIITLYPNHTFENERGEKFAAYRWQLSPEELVLEWQSGSIHYNVIESPGVYAGRRTDNRASRMIKLN